MYNKKVIILISVLIVLFLLLLILNMFRGSNTPTTLPQEIPIFNGSPRPSTSALIPQRPKSTYDTEALEKDYQRIVNKKELSTNDTKIRQDLINSLNGESGILNEGADFTIEYVKSPNIFMVEILDNDTEKSKKEATDWFKQKGLSSDGICNLPVKFYISNAVKIYLQSQNQTFDPIPEECR